MGYTINDKIRQILKGVRLSIFSPFHSWTFYFRIFKGIKTKSSGYNQLHFLRLLLASQNPAYKLPGNAGIFREGRYGLTTKS